MAISAGRRSITVPGMIPSDPFLERYWVRPGGATVVVLDGDDQQIGREAAVEKGEVDTIAEPLAAGDYSLVCTVPGHAAAGMVADLTVT